MALTRLISIVVCPNGMLFMSTNNEYTKEFWLMSRSRRKTFRSLGLIVDKITIIIEWNTPIERSQRKNKTFFQKKKNTRATHTVYFLLRLFSSITWNENKHARIFFIAELKSSNLNALTSDVELIIVIIFSFLNQTRKAHKRAWGIE